MNQVKNPIHSLANYLYLCFFLLLLFFVFFLSWARITTFWQWLIHASIIRQRITDCNIVVISFQIFHFFLRQMKLHVDSCFIDWNFIQFLTVCRSCCFEILYFCSGMLIAIYKMPLGRHCCASRLVRLSLYVIIKDEKIAKYQVLVVTKATNGSETSIDWFLLIFQYKSVFSWFFGNFPTFLVSEPSCRLGQHAPLLFLFS